jgi:hypothetical protein
MSLEVKLKEDCIPEIFLLGFHKDDFSEVKSRGW